ncbi:hypothetical protein V8G54_018393 [Vigna mungo]|uniref:Uncharacterized protein n=1 Tax=Vigna mungo TaxID=3915 RepID=A0AAQ3N9J7_VIGMU
MSIRTNKMKAVGVLMKQLRASRRKFHERGRDESFDGQLEKLLLVLNNIKDVFVEVKKNEEKLLDTLAEVYDHLHRLESKKLHQDMHSICESIRDSAHNLLPKLVFYNKGGKISHSSEELVQPHQKENLVENLRKLRRLSIRIGSEALIRDEEFESLGSLLALKHLKISWGVSDPRYAEIPMNLPLHLRKLHFECFPGKRLIKCLPRSDKWPCELNISGGKLESLSVNMTRNWTVEILRLKYLKQLNVDINNLKVWFPALKYVEIKQISNHSYIEHQWNL